jgi:transposase
VLQFLEDLTDRQAADAVRSRIDWKYALGLELTDAGFDFSVLSEFRSRLVGGNLEQRLLDRLLEQCRQHGWVKARGKQRTDATHVLAAIRNLNRLEGIAETLRAALNSLATLDPTWLQGWVPLKWYQRYGKASDEYYLPKGKEARKTYAELIGQDGMELLHRIWCEDAPRYLRDLPMIEQLRQTWVHQFWVDQATVRLRDAKDLPPAGNRMDSPYDSDARYSTKRSTDWVGYKVHLTETCDPEQMHLITNVRTTQAHLCDVAQTECIHADLNAKQVLPSQQHLTDSAYVDSALVLTSRKRYAIDLVGPVRPDSSWQAKDPNAYDQSQFEIHWKRRRVTCPQGHQSQSWTRTQDSWGTPLIHVRFNVKDCRECSCRQLCTHSPKQPRELTLRQQADHQVLQDVRRQQQTEDWQQIYNQRAGIEGTISQAVQCFGLRHTRYIGLQKTHLQHVLTSVALNINRITSWLVGIPHTQTRISRFAALAPDSA